jgi:predicted nucleotidyltransferase
MIRHRNNGKRVGSKPGARLSRAFVRRILKVVRPQKIILFGSRARGDSNPHSDYDILVVAPSRLPRWERTPKIYKALAGLGVPKDVVWWTPKEIKEWRSVESHFITTAIQEGKILYEKKS